MKEIVCEGFSQGSYFKKSLSNKCEKCSDFGVELYSIITFLHQFKWTSINCRSV